MFYLLRGNPLAQPPQVACLHINSELQKIQYLLQGHRNHLIAHPWYTFQYLILAQLNKGLPHRRFAHGILFHDFPFMDDIVRLIDTFFYLPVDSLHHGFFQGLLCFHHLFSNAFPFL